MFILLAGLAAACSSDDGILEVSITPETVTALVRGEATSTVTLHNNGDGDLYVDITYSEEDHEAGPQFKVEGDLDDVYIEPGGSHRLTVRFKPIVVGESSLTLEFGSIASTTPTQRTIRGIGENNLPELTWVDLPESACLGVPITVAATVTDVEDKDQLGRIQARLESSLEGELYSGTFEATGAFGEEVTFEEDGEHELTLSATDSHDGTGEAFATLVVTSDDTNDDGIVDCRDGDGDTFSYQAGDCDDKNDKIHPDARDVCSGIDENCDGVIDSLAECDLDGDGTSDWVDDDKDGQTELGGDCDDQDPTTYTGAAEVCDSKDNDCDSTVDDGFDQDNDGYFAGCQENPDCDDTAPGVHPGADESCNEVDDDCDTQVDEDLDTDGDGYSCAQDCGEGDTGIYPGAPEICDGLDQDCDDVLDDGFDHDNDGFTSCGGDCDDEDPSTNPQATELCNLKDDDCDDETDEDPAFDQDADGQTSCGGDCDDQNAAVHTDATEQCNQRDDDCDDEIDEDFDDDGDGFSDAVCPYGADCDDQNSSVNPGADEVCDRLDNDCDQQIDEGFDQDRDGAYSETECPFGTDCNDQEGAINPSANEVCDEMDNNCDGQIDDTDQDGDDYIACDEGPLGDCNDFDPEVNPDPSTKELCDLIDNNCDGNVDEDFDRDGDGYSSCVGDCLDPVTGIDYDQDPTQFPVINDSGWIEYLCNPVLPVTPDTDDFYTDQASILEDPDAPEAERFKAWYRYGEDADANKANLRIGYATSPDGIHWTKQGVVLERGPSGAFDSARLNYPSVLKREDGRYHMWYQGYNGSSFAIGYATSPDGRSWTRQNEGKYVLGIGQAGSWDERSVQAPSVLWVPSAQLYYMWYGGVNKDRNIQIGLATSPDGIVWTKHDGSPETPELDPVIPIGSSSDWDSARVNFPRVYFNGDFFDMFYSGANTATSWHIGYAWSEDGINWKKYSAVPVLRHGGAAWKAGSIYSPMALTDTDPQGRTVYEMWFSGGASESTPPFQTGRAINYRPDLYIVPLKDDTYTKDDTIVLQGYIDDPFVVDSVTVVLESDLEGAVAVEVPDERGVVTFRVKLSVGEHTLSMLAQDAGGLQTIDQISLSILE